MKKYAINFILLILIQNCLKAQSCLPEGITFSNQGQIDNFSENYPGCHHIEGNVTIMGDFILNLQGLYPIHSIGGNLEMNNLSDLKYLTGFDSLTYIVGNVIIEDNFGIKSLHALNSVITIEGDLEISTCTSLQNLDGFDNLNRIGGSFDIYYNPNIVDITGMTQLDTIGKGLRIMLNEILTNMSGLIDLDYIGEDLDIYLNDSLNTLSGLGNVKSVGNHLTINYNNKLTDLSGFDNLETVSGDIFISSNYGLDEINGLNSLSTVGGFLWLSHNNKMNQLNGFHNLTSVGKSVNIQQMDELIIFNAFESLDSVNGYISLGSNLKLTNLDGLQNLTRINGKIFIDGNPLITDISGLENIDSATVQGLSIYYNASLSNCAIKSICDYLAGPGDEVVITLNGEGCNSPEEVESDCLAGVDEKDAESICNVSPNPASDFAEFQLQISDFGKVILKIYNMWGEDVATLIDQELAPGMHQITWNASSITPGLYFYHQSEVGNQKSAFGKILIAR